jgi:hypothetical protein
VDGGVEGRRKGWRGRRRGEDEEENRMCGGGSREVNKKWG